MLKEVQMDLGIDYKKEIINLSKELPDDELKELIDFGQFLKAKKRSFSFTEVKDSPEYVRKLREEEGRKFKSGKKFIEELIEWQKSNS
jgi:hypothetical protein